MRDYVTPSTSNELARQLTVRKATLLKAIRRLVRRGRLQRDADGKLRPGRSEYVESYTLGDLDFLYAQVEAELAMCGEVHRARAKRS